MTRHNIICIFVTLAVAVLTSCGKQDIPVADVVGLWETEWEASPDKFEIDAINIHEYLRFDDAVSETAKKKFLQVMTGEVAYSDFENETTLDFCCTIEGLWAIDGDQILMNYNLETMSVKVAKSNIKGDYTSTAMNLLSGDFGGMLGNYMIEAAEEKRANDKVNKMVPRVVERYFKEYFATMNRDKEALTDVRVENGTLYCDVNDGIFGREQVYTKCKSSSSGSSRGSDNGDVSDSRETGSSKASDVMEASDGNLSGTSSNSATTFDPSSLDLASYRLTESDLSGYSKSELRILRNYIFARHGYIFKSQDLREYFSKQSWYNPTSHDVSGKLNKTEQYNVEFIQRHE